MTQVGAYGIANAVKLAGKGLERIGFGRRKRHPRRRFVGKRHRRILGAERSAALHRAVETIGRPGRALAVLGPFFVSEHKAGSYVLLERNPNYWKRDKSGQRLPYLDSIRLDIQQNRDIELFRFRQGQLRGAKVLALHFQ